MQTGQPSRTAFAAAAHRAAHQILERGSIFADPFAVRILGESPDTLTQQDSADPLKRRMRLFIAMRTRFAEDTLRAAVDCGVRQLVVLGAGLDTFAYRSSFGDRLPVFEVDHPATQAWKRLRLGEAGIPIPPYLTFAAVDFERETLAEGLVRAGFDPDVPTFFTWLGVVPYLTEAATFSTLGFIATLPGGAHVVFDYADPPHTLRPEARAEHDLRAARVSAVGEAWVQYFDAPTLCAQLEALGFRHIDDLGPRQILARFFPHRAAAAPERGGHILHASTFAA